MQVEFYTKTDGTKPAGEFMKSLEPKMKKKMSELIFALERFGTKLRAPYSKHIQDGIFELRAQVGTDISRALYFFYVGDKAIITNGFVKKTPKTPPNEIEKARFYRADYLNREDE